MAFMELAAHLMCSCGVLQYLVRECSGHIGLSCLGILKGGLPQFFSHCTHSPEMLFYVYRMCIVHVHVCVPE